MASVTPLDGTWPPAAEERWFLRVENITGPRPPAAGYQVALSAPDREIVVGNIAAFGIAEASRSDAEHDGSGLTDAFDVSDAVHSLQEQGAWDQSTVRVKLTPVSGSGKQAPGGEVTAGRISIYRD